MVGLEILTEEEALFAYYLPTPSAAHWVRVAGHLSFLVKAGCIDASTRKRILFIETIEEREEAMKSVKEHLLNQ